MARPGVVVVNRTAPPTRGAPTDTGVAFFAGIAEKGPADKALTVHNMAEFETSYGGRPNGMILYDACDIAFRKGVTAITIARAVGPDATKDTATLQDAGAVDSIAVDTIGPGASALTVQPIAGSLAGTFVLVIVDTDLGKEVDRSRDLASPVDAVDWSGKSDFVRVRAVGGNNPAPLGAGVALAGGDDDRAAITDVERAAALLLLPKTLGPGQVAYPGATTAAAHAALLNHAKLANRWALLDAQDTPSDTTLEAEADGDRAAPDKLELAETFGMLLGPWHVARGVAGGTTRTVPPSAVVAGLIATSDARTGNPNTAAAGANGDSSDVTLALSQPAWDDDTRERLNDAGVNIFREVWGGFRLYGFRSLADMTDPDSAAWQSAGAGRTRMAITNELEAYAEQFVFAQLDGQGQTIARFKGGLMGILQKYWANDALYGASAPEAFVVDTGPTVNTENTLAANELHAVIGLRVSPFAELVYIEVVKVPSNQAL